MNGWIKLANERRSYMSGQYMKRAHLYEQLLEYSPLESAAPPVTLIVPDTMGILRVDVSDEHYITYLKVLGAVYYQEGFPAESALAYLFASALKECKTALYAVVKVQSVDFDSWNHHVAMARWHGAQDEVEAFTCANSNRSAAVAACLKRADQIIECEAIVFNTVASVLEE